MNGWINEWDKTNQLNYQQGKQHYHLREDHCKASCLKAFSVEYEEKQETDSLIEQNSAWHPVLGQVFWETKAEVRLNK